MASGGHMGESEARRWRQQFVSEVFHALSQPLTALHCSLEIALKKGADPQEQRGALRDALLMAATAIESAKFVRLMAEAEDPGDVKPVLLGRILIDIRDELRPVAESNSTSIVCSFEKEVVVCADQRRLREALFLLTDSALDSAHKRDLHIELRVRRTFVIISIGTAGQCSAASRMASGPRANKPILLAQKIIQAIGGELLEQNSREGFRWIVRLPRISDFGAGLRPRP